MRAATVLLSGGMDSALCAAMLKTQGFNVRGLFVDYGQIAVDDELAAARRVAEFLEIGLEVQTLRGGVPRDAGEQLGRNALLVSVAVFLSAGTSGLVVLGVHSGTPYYDCSPPFVTALDQLVREQTNGEVGLLAPLLNWTKPEVFQALKAAGVPPSITYSCECGGTPCGGCSSCLDRKALEC